MKVILTNKDKQDITIEFPISNEEAQQAIDNLFPGKNLDLNNFTVKQLLELPEGLNGVHFKDVIAECSDIDMVVSTVNDIVENFDKYTEDIKNEVIKLLNDGHSLDDIVKYVSDNWEQIGKDVEQFFDDAGKELENIGNDIVNFFTGKEKK